jgi:hypothetical protein
MDDQTFVSVPDFNLQFNTAKTVIREVGGNSLAEEQERLRKLVPLMAEEEREWATDMIDWLPELTKPQPPPSALMLEAMEVQAKASATRGTSEEMHAAINAARKRIWEIADRAPKSEAAHIRGLTRTLDHFQQSMDDPFWEDSLPPADAGQA